RVSESLAGRIQIITLWPLSQGEVLGQTDQLVDALFAGLDLPGRTPPGLAPPVSRADLIAMVLRGGFPEVVTRPDDDRRLSWFASYVDTLLSRDVRDMASIENLHAMPRLLKMLAARVGGVSNQAGLSRDLAMP